jgi:hypothetical protein
VSLGLYRLVAGSLPTRRAASRRGFFKSLAGGCLEKHIPQQFVFTACIWANVARVLTVSRNFSRIISRPSECIKDSFASCKVKLSAESFRRKEAGHDKIVNPTNKRDFGCFLGLMDEE